MRDLIETTALYALAIGLIALTFSTLTGILSELVANALAFHDKLGL